MHGDMHAPHRTLSGIGVLPDKRGGLKRPCGQILEPGFISAAAEGQPIGDPVKNSRFLNGRLGGRFSSDGRGGKIAQGGDRGILGKTDDLLPGFDVAVR